MSDYAAALMCLPQTANSSKKLMVGMAVVFTLPALLFEASKIKAYNSVFAYLLRQPISTLNQNHNFI